MKIYLKNMVCQGTRKFVLMELKKLGLKLKSFEMGEMEFRRDLSDEEEYQLEISLKKYGLEMIAIRGNEPFLTPSYHGTDHISEYEYLMENSEVQQTADMSLVD